jgi:hypothetical protein
VVRSFRAVQASIVVFTGASAVPMVLLVTLVLPFHWWVLVVIFMAGELTFQSAIVISTFVGKKKRPHSSTGQQVVVLARPDGLSSFTSNAATSPVVTVKPLGGGN